MEKLVLRGIMYGADKVPDSWFDKIPLDYYKAKQPTQHSRHDSMSARRPSSRGGARRRYSDEYDSPSRQDYDRRSSRYAADHKRTDSHRSRSSYTDRYDGDRYSNADFEDRVPRRRHDYPDDRPDHPLDRPSRPDRRRMHDDSDHDRFEPARHDRDGPDRPVSPFTAAVATTAAAAGVAASQQAAAGESHPKPAGQYTGYVPYSNIYGASHSKSGQPFSPPPRSSISSVQPNDLNQVTTSRQNQLSPDTSLLDGAGDPRRRAPPYTSHRYPADYNDQYYSQANYDPYYPDERYPGSYDREYDHERYTPARHDPRPTLRRRSYGDSFDSRDAPWRSPSPPRQRNKNESQSQISNKAQRPRGKSMSRVKESFDKSQRGLGYGAIGAITGGLVGSEVGKGPVHTAIGAVLGGLGANMFEARERKKDSTRGHGLAKDDDRRARREYVGQERLARDGHSPV